MRSCDLVISSDVLATSQSLFAFVKSSLMVGNTLIRNSYLLLTGISAPLPRNWLSHVQLDVDQTLFDVANTPPSTVGFK
jgi:hypothetical protein